MQFQTFVLLSLMSSAFSQLGGIHFSPKFNQVTKTFSSSVDLERCPMPWSETCHRSGGNQRCYPGEVCPPCWTLISDQWNCYNYTPGMGCPYNWVDIRRPQTNHCTQSGRSNCLIK